MSKAKVRRWVVRESKVAGGWYWLFVGDKPCKDSKRAGWGCLAGKGGEPECARSYEWFMPKCYHLTPGGGPVEIEFKERV